jgi:hypothetical protein
MAVTAPMREIRIPPAVECVSHRLTQIHTDYSPEAKRDAATCYTFSSFQALTNIIFKNNKITLLYNY